MSIWYYICLHAFHQSYTVSGSEKPGKASEGKEQKEPFFCPFMFVTSKEVLASPCDTCGFSSKALSTQLTAHGVHFCFLTQPPRKIWCYSVGQSSQSVCHSWLVSPVVTYEQVVEVLGVFWLCFLVLVCWLGGGEGFEGVFLLVFHQLSEKLVYEMLTFSWTVASHWYVLSAGPIHPTSQAVLRILCRATSLAFVSLFSSRLHRISDFLANINRVIPHNPVR